MISRPRQRKPTIDLINHFACCDRAELRSAYWRRLLKFIARFYPHDTFGAQAIGDAIGCSATQVRRVAKQIMDACGGQGLEVHYHRKRGNDGGWVLRFRLIDCPPAPSAPIPKKAKVSAGCCTDADKGRSPTGLHPDCITRIPVPASARTRARPQARPVSTQQDNPEPANAGPRAAPPSNPLAPTPWERRNRDAAIRRHQWLVGKRGLLHWVQVKSPDDFALLDKALWAHRQGWFRDLSPEERARINELDELARAEPLDFEIPDERRQRERLREPPVQSLPGGPVLTPAQARRAAAQRGPLPDPAVLAAVHAAMTAPTSTADILAATGLPTAANDLTQHWLDQIAADERERRAAS